MLESLLPKFLKLVSMWMRQDVIPENIKAVAESIGNTLNAYQHSQELNILPLLYVEFCEKIWV